MTSIVEKLASYWAYPFVRYAFVVGVLIALCSSLLGVTLVPKRFSFIGDGFPMAFGAMAIAAVLQLTNEMPPDGCYGPQRRGTEHEDQGRCKIRHAISVGSALAVGYLLMNIFFHSSNLRAMFAVSLAPPPSSLCR